MPLYGGKQNIGRNIGELVRSKPSKTRAKGIRTLARRRGISEKEAKQKQAIAIALSRARRK
jgi:hypothetical protein